MKDKKSINWKTILSLSWPLILGIAFFAYIYATDSGGAGQKLYDQHCANCHMENGKGFRSLYPPLAGADYVQQAGPELACILRYGIQDSMLVNGKWYNQAMPANSLLKDQEIAALVNFIKNSWGNKNNEIPFVEIKASLDACKESQKTKEEKK